MPRPDIGGRLDRGAFAPWYGSGLRQFQRYNAALAEILRDVRHTIRTLARQRTFTLTVLAGLALAARGKTASL